MDFLSGNGESARAEKNGRRGAGRRSGLALPGQMSSQGRAAIRWEKVLDVGSTEPVNITWNVTVTDNGGGR
jgi:hypothetical protein